MEEVGQTFAAASVQLTKKGSATMESKEPKAAEEETASATLAPEVTKNEEDEDDEVEVEEFELAPAGCTQIYNASGGLWSQTDGLRDTYRRSVRTGKLVYYGGAVVTARKSTGGKCPPKRMAQLQ